MSEFAHKPSDEEIFTPALSRLVTGVACVAPAVAVAWVAFGSGAPRWLFDVVYAILLAGRHSSGPIPSVLSVFQQWLLGLVALPLFTFGALRLVQAICGLPRLTVTSDGIELQTAFRTRSAKWNSLEKFELRVQRGGKGGPSYSATSIVSGKSASNNLSGGTKLVIPDSFSMSIPELITTLNARRAQALGLPNEPTVEDTSKDSSGIGTTLALAGGLVLGAAVAIIAAHH
jgi:hypothetical protein